MVILNFKNRDPIYRQIADQIKNHIMANQLKPGDMLPSIRKLAIKLDVDPNTVQRAYLDLRLEGWIDTVPGKGCFVSITSPVSDHGGNSSYTEDNCCE